MVIDNRQKTLLRSIGHKLKPIVTVASNGLTDKVLKEIQRALSDHELIKVKLAIIDRQQRKETTVSICHHTQAVIAQVIGKTALLYLPAPKPNMKLSNVNTYREDLRRRI